MEEKKDFDKIVDEDLKNVLPQDPNEVLKKLCQKLS